MFKKIFQAPVPYRMADDPTLAGRYGTVPYQPLLNYFTTPPRIYGEEFFLVTAFFVKKEPTATSPTTITLNVISKNVYFPAARQSIKFDGATGALIGYGDYIGGTMVLDKEIVQSTDGSLWIARDGYLSELDPTTYAILQTIPADFFEIPASQLFHGIAHPMIDRARDLIVMSGFPSNTDGRFITVNDFKTGALIRRIWVSGAVTQIMQEDDRRCFVVCSNGIINVVDYTTGEILSATRSPLGGDVNPFKVTYAWDPILRRLLGFSLAVAANPDGSSPNSIVGFYPVPLATNITKPIPLKAPRKGRTVPMLVRAVGDAGEPIPSLPINATATAPGQLAPGSRVTDSCGYVIINLTSTDAGSSEVTVTANVDDGASGVVVGGSSGGPAVAPILSAPTATPTGATTAAGTVSTNQDNGWLYALLSTSSTATVPDVEAGQVQTVTASGTQTVNISSLTPDTTYYPHYLHRNSAGLDSAVANGTSFTTSATGTGTDTGGGQSAQPVAVGSQIAPLSVENTSSSAATNQPFSIGHAFATGHLPASGAAITLNLPDGSTIPAQINVKALHADGSVRHAQVSGMIPSIAAGASVVLSMKRTAAPGAGSDVGIPANLPSATVKIGSVTYTAACDGLTPIAWFAGPVVSEFMFRHVQFLDGSGVAHPTLRAQLSVRAFASGQVRMDYVIEHCQAYASIADITYDATLYMGTTAVYTRTGLVHTPTGRWRRTFWQGSAPVLHTKHDIPYLLDSEQVPNYDRTITVTDSYLDMLTTALNSGNFEPMKFGRFRAYMPDYGGRPDIGLMPDSHAALVLSLDKRAWDLVMAAGDIGGSWPICRRDDSNGPGRGCALSINNFPYSSIAGSESDCNNPATGKNEHLPSLTSATQGVSDVSHQPDIYYLPYLLSGDYFYLEGLHFFGTFCLYNQNPYYRDFEQGHIRAEQVRGQGWTLRTLAECAAITPDDHYLKAHFIGWYSNNMKWYLDAYIDAPIPTYANQLPFIANGSSIEYNVGGGTTNGMAPWMDDFFTQALGHGYELLKLDSTRRLLMWKVKFQVDRMNNPAVCIQNACIYSLAVRATTPGAFFTNLADCINFSVDATEQLYACNSPSRLALHDGCQAGDVGGYPDSESGYPSNYQPALSYAVNIGYPGADQAWTKFMSRPTKPNYGALGPQFAIVPR